MTQISDLQKETRSRRDLATRGRRLAFTQLNKADQERLNRYADEMERLADELEAQAAAQRPNPAPVVTRAPFRGGRIYRCSSINRAACPVYSPTILPVRRNGRKQTT